MLQGLFNYDNPVWRYIGKFGDLMLLNVLWIVCSIPIFTIGASTTAVYYVTLKLVRDEDGYTFRSFFKSFRENFKQATAIWLLLLGTGIILLIDIRFFLIVLTGTSMVRTLFTAAVGALTILWLFILTYAFPLQCRFYNPVKRTLFNAFFMSVRHFFHTLGMLGIDAIVLVMAYFSIFYMPQLSVLMILFGFPLIAFINSYIFNSIFKRYMPDASQERGEEELKPILEDVQLSPQPDPTEEKED